MLNVKILESREKYNKNYLPNTQQQPPLLFL